MKKILTMVMMMTIAISAAAMPYNTARNEALFLSDKMVYELGLTTTQYEAVYEINLDYLLNLDTRADVFGFWWDVRNRDLRYVLSTWQYDRFMASEWFYRPVIWTSTGATFSIYTRYGAGRMFFDRPAVFVTFKGGHSHRSGSYYSGHHYDKPNPPTGHGNNNHNNNGNHNNGNHNNGNHNNGGWNHNGYGNGNHNNNGNGNWNHGGGNHNNGTPNGNGNHNNNPSTGGGHRTSSNGNHTPSVSGFGNNHGSGTTNAPSRTSSRASGSMAGSGSTSRGTFGK